MRTKSLNDLNGASASLDMDFENLTSISNSEQILVANILVENTFKEFNSNPLSYLIPSELINEVQAGSLVVVPFGKKLVRGLVFSLEQKSCEELELSTQNYHLKPINKVLKSKIVNENYLKLLSWVSEFFCCDLWTTLKGTLPISLFGTLQEKYSLIEDINFEEMKRQSSLDELKLLELFDDSSARNLSLSYIKQKVKSKNLLVSIRSLLQKGFLRKETIEKKGVKKKRKNDKDLSIIQKQICLNDEQLAIFKGVKNYLDKKIFKKLLIHGVTGSGKTEIYFEAAKQVLARGERVLYLLPEISLTVQMIERLQQAFAEEEIIVWHSNLSDGKRVEAWEKCLSGEAKIIIGARSAVFAPVEDIGLIIVDEEHDSSFKSGNKPFYDAKLIAEQRAKDNKAVLLLGSATPSVETYYDLQATSSVLELQNRFKGQVLPEVEIVDLRQELNDGNRSIFSRALRKSLNQCIEKKEQAILLLNRRGFANYVFCRDCGYAHFCDHCSVPMIYHAHDDLMRCHHCNFQMPVLKNCPECGSPRIKQAGLGTQRLEQEVKRNFPDADVVRLDRDISSKRNGMQEIWEKLSSGFDGKKGQILVGTQLVAKGIDLPNVTLVSAIHAESGMYSTDFNAAEKTFQLLTQAAGRAGRHDKPGKVIFQTYNPENKIIQYAAKHDYKSFYNEELLGRQEFNFPPFVNLARFVISNEDDVLASHDAEKLAESFRKDFSSVEFPLEVSLEVLGPAPCPIEKINKLYRWHVLFKAKELALLQEIGRGNPRSLNLKSRVIFDLMPNSLI